MAEQDQVPQGAIPPKVSPFAKPEGAAPGVPNAPRPITVRLKPAVAPAAAAHAAPVVGIQTPAPANPRSTARVPMPEVPGSEPVAQKGEAAAAPRPAMAAPATVRLRPVMPAPAGARAPGTPPSATPPPSAPMPAVSPLQPQPPPAPGSHPLPDGPKPLSGVQVQASKSKTSRISLDSAIGVAPMSPMNVDKAEPKTIRLKRPSDLAAAPSAPKSSTTPIRQTSRIPDSVLPNAETKTPEPGAITQKKTLKIKRPGAKVEGASAEEGGTPGEAFPENVQMTPISALNLPEKQESSAFTAVAVAAAAAAAVVLLLLTLCLGAHAMGPDAGKNAVASIGGPELPWAGRISD